jgi:hypothetical protein
VKEVRDYLVDMTKGEEVIEVITPPARWHRVPLGALSPFIHIGRVRTLIEVFDTWPNEN